MSSVGDQNVVSSAFFKLKIRHFDPPSTMSHLHTGVTPWNYSLPTQSKAITTLFSNSGRITPSFRAKMSAKKKDLFADLEIYDDSIHGKDFCPLAMGAPGPSTLQGCSELMMEATKQLLNNKSEEKYTFQYGPCRGDPDFCEEMAKFLTLEYGDKVSSEDIFVTAGATNGLHLVTTVMFDTNTPVFIEDPTYFIGTKILRNDLGMNLIPVPTDDEGINVDMLEELFIEYKPKSMNGLKSPFWSFVYTIPTFNNPKGYCMSEERCKQLVKLARKHKVMVFAEDVYNLIHFRSEGCPKRLFAYDDRSDPDYLGNVVSNCTFSKILAPGLRLGWIEAPPRILECLEKSYTAWSGGSFNHYTSKLMTTALREGLLQKHLSGLRVEYGERMDIVCQILKNNLPESVKFHKPEGGFFIWLELPPTADTAQLLELTISKYKMNFINGESTSPTGSCHNCVRLSISYCDKNMVERGTKNFCDAVKDILT